MKNVVMMGAYDLQAPAEEAMFEADLTRLRELIPEAHLVVLSDSPEYIRNKYKVDTEYSMKYHIYVSRSFIPLICRVFAIVNLPLKGLNLIFKLMRLEKRIPYFGFPSRIRALIIGRNLLHNIKRLKKGQKFFLLGAKEDQFLKTLQRADLVFHTGGGDLNSLSFGSFYAYGFTYLMAKSLDKPVVISAQTIGPFYNQMDKIFAKYVLDKVNLITLRDKGLSKRILQDIGITRPIIKEAVDDAFFLSSANQDQIIQVFRKESIPVHHPLVGINVQEHPKVQRLIPILARIGDYLTSVKKAKVIFIPMKSVSNGDNDIVAISKVKDLMKSKNEVYTIKHIYDGQTLKGIFGQMSLVISTRYHPIVFATSMLVPSIGLVLNQYYFLKIKGILEMAGYKKHICPIDNVSFDQLKSLIDNALLDGEQIKRKLQGNLQSLKKDYLFAVKYAAKLLQAS